MVVSLNSVASNAELGYFLARLFHLFRGNDPRNAISNELRPLFGAQFFDHYVPTSNFSTAWYLGGDADLRVLLIDGVENADQSARLINGYAGTHGTFDVNGLNAWLRDAADSIMQPPVFNQIVQPFKALLIAGYSAGGAIGQWCAKRWQASGHVFDARLITFGSPRGMSPPDLAALSQLDVCRWMVDADPIPTVPPRFEDSPVLYLSLGLQLSIIYGSYVHLRNGFSLAADGSVTPSFLPPLAQSNVIGSLISWYSGKANDPSNPHWIGNYEDRLFRLKQMQTIPGQPQTHGPATEPTENASRREIQAQERLVAGEVAHRAATQNATPVDIEKTVLFKAVRFNRVWCVAFGDSIICFSGNKRRARHLARAGNDFLRSMPKQAVVDPESIINQMSSFFNAAVVPGGPVNPPISVGL